MSNILEQKTNGLEGGCISEENKIITVRELRVVCAGLLEQEICPAEDVAARLLSQEMRRTALSIIVRANPILILFMLVSMLLNAAGWVYIEQSAYLTAAGFLFSFPYIVLSVLFMNVVILRQLTKMFDWWFIQLNTIAACLAAGRIFQWDVRAFSSAYVFLLSTLWISCSDAKLGRSRLLRASKQFVFYFSIFLVLFSVVGFSVNMFPNTANRQVAFRTMQFSVTVGGFFRSRCLDIVVVFGRCVFADFRRPGTMVFLKLKLYIKYAKEHRKTNSGSQLVSKFFRKRSSAKIIPERTAFIQRHVRIYKSQESIVLDPTDNLANLFFGDSASLKVKSVAASSGVLLVGLGLLSPIFCILSCLKIRGYQLLGPLSIVCSLPLTVTNLLLFNRKICSELVKQFSWLFMNINGLLVGVCAADMLGWDVRGLSTLGCTMISMPIITLMDAKMGSSKTARLSKTMCFMANFIFGFVFLTCIMFGLIPDLQKPSVIVTLAYGELTTADLFLGRIFIVLIYYIRFLYSCTFGKGTMVVLVREAELAYDVIFQDAATPSIAEE